MEPFSAVILAGGRSQRMGQEKAWLDAGGQPLILRVVERLQDMAAEIITVRSPTSAPNPLLPGRSVEDRYPGAGPLAGIHAGLSAAQTSWIFAVACDMPFLNRELIRYLALLRPGHDAVVPYPMGRPEPLHAFYHRRCLPTMDAHLRRGQRALFALLADLDTRAVSRSEIAVFDHDLRSFTNINTPEEWAQARQMADWDHTARG